MSDAKKQTVKIRRPTGLEDLRRLAAALNISVDVMEDVSILAQPARAGQLILPNSLAVHPMEAADGDSAGRPGELTFRRYERFARGGAGLIWMEAVAVAPEARANPRQLWLNKTSIGSFASLVSTISKAAAAGPLKHRPIIVAQLTHSGRYSKPQGTPHPLICQHDPYRDVMKPQPKPDRQLEKKVPHDWPILTDEYLDAMKDAYVQAASLAFDAGFDAVDIKSCHGYLIGELLACYERKGKYGGAFENRTRFLLEVIDKIRRELGDEKPIVVRLGVYDGVPYPYGWGVDNEDFSTPDLREPKMLVEKLLERGVKMINVTAGDPHYNPHYGRPFSKPVRTGYETPEHPLIGVQRLIGLAGQIQKQFRDAVVVGTGYTWLGTLMANVAAASKAKGLSAIIGAGRMALAYPDFAKDIILKGKLDAQKVCTACSCCSQIMIDGGMIGCVPKDNEIYGPIYDRCSRGK